MLADKQAGLWLSPVPFDQVPERFQVESQQWRDALLPVLRQQSEILPGELVARGLAECRRVFGREISESTWRRHFELAIERDRNCQQWGRVDIYVAEEAFAHGPSVDAARSALVTGDMNSLTDTFSQRLS